MKKVIVNLTEKTVTINNETCNTYEAGLEHNYGEVMGDVLEIVEHFQDREGECEVIFEDANELINGTVVTDEDNNEWLQNDSTGRMLWMNRLQNGYFDNECEGEITEQIVPDEIGGSGDLKKVKVIKNQDCGNAYEVSDLQFNGSLWIKA